MQNDTEMPILVDDRGPVRWISLNRPAVHNAQNAQMLRALDAVFDECTQSTNVRVVVLTGVGRSFSSGHDLSEMSRNPEYAANASTAEGRYRQERALFVNPVIKFRHLPMPTICLIRGYCLAGALMFAAAADFCLAADDSSFGSPVLADLAVNDAEVPTFMLRVGERRAKQAIWLNERWDAEAALRAGLVNWVVPSEDLEARSEGVIENLLRMPPEALALSKDVFNFMADAAGESSVIRYHYMSHQFSHQTAEAQARLRERLSRVAGGGSAVRREPI